MKIDNMLEKGGDLFHQDPKKVGEQLFQAVLESAIRQYEKCNLYRQLCKQKNFDPHRDLKSAKNFKDITYLTTPNFKRQKGRPKEFLSVPESEIKLWATSSGTSGDPSMIGRDQVTLQRFFKTMDITYKEVWNLKDYQWTLLFVPPIPQQAPDDKKPVTAPIMLWILDATNKIPMKDRIYALRLATDAEKAASGRPYIPDVKTVLSFLKSGPSKKGIGYINGSAPLLYSLFAQIYKETGETFNVGEKTVIASGGGWKTYSGQEVTKAEFRGLMTKVLGVQDQNVHDLYAFTEMDCVFAECEHHNKHVPPWCDVIVRDFKTLEPVPVGEKGLFNVINPLAHSYAGISILQDDVVRIAMEDGCPCGRRGKVLEVIGRAAGAEAKGCGAQLAEETAS